MISDYIVFWMRHNARPQVSKKDLAFAMSASGDLLFRMSCLATARRIQRMRRK